MQNMDKNKPFMNSAEVLKAVLGSDTESEREISSGDEYKPSSTSSEEDYPTNSPQTESINDKPNETQTQQKTDNNTEVRGRKRVRNEENWKQNIRKRARNKGEEYETRAGKPVKRRKYTYHRCGRCVNRCNDVLSDDQRDQIFKNYWQMGDWQRQRDYIANHVYSKPTKRKTRLISKRKQTLQYFFTVDGNKVKVCKAVFLKTLGIGEKTVTYTIEHPTSQACTDKRGRQAPGIKKSEELRNTVKNHIASFPCMESHYARSKTKKLYLEQSLNVTKMYELYHEKYIQDPSKQVNLKYYRDVFNTDFNMSFHRPKKDVCNFCFSYNNSSEHEKQAIQDEYNNHHVRKTRVRELKAEHKNLSREDGSVHAVTFDLEQVLSSPKLNVSSLFYRRKLSTYNLTVYDLGNHNVTCYMWHEGVAGRGSCEIASCIFSYFKSLPKEIKRVILYSDTCSGQNRNQYFTAMCLNIVQRLGIDCIDHLFMESGHSQMECDSAHSTIEFALKKQDVYSPLDYYRIVAMARRFEVKLMSTEDVIDFKSYCKLIIRNKSKDTNGETVNWLKLKWLRYLHSSPDTFYFKYDYDKDFKSVRVNQGLRLDSDALNLKPLFEESPCISKAKYEDLKFLCTSLAIPRPYHDFYLRLNFDGKKDTLPQTDVEESDEIDVQ